MGVKSGKALWLTVAPTLKYFTIYLLETNDKVETLIVLRTVFHAAFYLHLICCGCIFDIIYVMYIAVFSYYIKYHQSAFIHCGLFDLMINLRSGT